MKQRRINIDFDNTLTEGDVNYWEGERPTPNEDMVEWARQQYHDHNTIVIWTARPWSEAARVAAHCTEWGVKFHGIRCNKGSADLYVDDSATRPREVVGDDA